MIVEGDDESIRIIPETKFEIQWLMCWSMNNVKVDKERTAIRTTIIKISNSGFQKKKGGK